MGTVRIMYGHHKSEPEYMEQIITEKEERFEEAEVWAKENGFVTRIATINLDEPPDFVGTITV